MASDRILALNVGSGHLALGEFKIAAGKPPVLLRYGVAPLGLDPDSEMDASGFIIAALDELMKNCGIKPGPLLMAVPGQTVFPRFVKFPAIAQDKLRGMIQSEAEQNVPFPIDELTWDYQMIGSADLGECNAMIVAAKTESIVSLTNSIGAAKLEPEAVDVAPLAIYNCVSGCYGGLEGCTMVLDIGSRSTNLVFVEEGKVFYRSIPVAGNAITQEISKTFGVDFRAAEQMKCDIGFVALGGVTATEDEKADRVSKCIRSVVTRLHAEVNRSINFYRSQQGGSAPARVLLTGGTAALEHLDTFFREKLRIDVDFLNPFGGIELGPRIDQEKIEGDFAQLSEIVGLALRRSGLGKVAINLMPPNLVERKTIRRQTPVLAVAGAALVAASVFMMLAGGEKLGEVRYERDAFAEKRRAFDAVSKRITAKETEREEVAKEIAQYRDLLFDREVTLRCLEAVRASMLPGLWLVSLESAPVQVQVGETTQTLRGFRIVAKGFQDSMRQMEQKLKDRDKTAPEIFCEHLANKSTFLAAHVTGQRPADANNVVEFTVEVALAPRPAVGDDAGKGAQR